MDGDGTIDMDEFVGKKQRLIIIDESKKLQVSCVLTKTKIPKEVKETAGGNILMERVLEFL